MIFSKLGLHIMATGQFEASRILRETPPAVVKFILPIDAGFWNGIRVPEVADCQPQTLIIGKPMHGNIILGVGLGEEYRAGYTPDKVAEAYWTKYQAPMIEAYPKIQMWEIFNEFEHDTELDPGAQYRWYAQCCAAVAQRLHAAGKRAAICALATHRPNVLDCPQWEQWFIPALEACRNYDAIFSRHGYDSVVPSIDGSLRYRDDLRRFAALGYGDVKIVITECGWDWPPVHSRGGSMADYINQYCVPLEMAMREDSGVVGATLYCYGTGGANQQFDAADPKNEFANAWIALAQAHPIPPTVPPLAPDQYRVYNCQALNMRGFPWTGATAPPVMRVLQNGETVTVYSVCKFGSMAYGWALISPNGNEWVSARYLSR
jgi:hypothetical protein